jgi:hypothetical protein
MTYFSLRVATTTLGDGVEMRIDDEIETRGDEDSEISRSRTISFKYMNGKIEMCLLPHSELTRFGLDHGTTLFCGAETPVGKIQSHVNASNSDREVICFIENKERPDEFIVFSYKCGEIILVRHGKDEVEHEIFKHKNIFDINLIDRNATPHGHDAPKVER